MKDSGSNRILADRPHEEFVGRDAELQQMLGHAAGGASEEALIVSGPPNAGTSELLKQCFDRLFAERGQIVPFYFQIEKDVRSVRETAVRFVHQFLLQSIAFRRGDPSILKWIPDMCELSQLVSPADGHWVDRIVEFCTRDCPAGGENAFIDECFGAPLRAAASGLRVFVMIDDCHHAVRSNSGREVFDLIKDAYRNAGIPYVLAGRRRFRFDEVSARRLLIEPLSISDAVVLAEQFSERFGVATKPETRDLIAVQFCGDPTFMRSIFQSAAEKKLDLLSFANVEKVYAHEIFGGRIADIYGSAVRDIAGSLEVQNSIVSLLDVAATLGQKKLSIGAWRERLAVSEPEFTRILDRLHVRELIRLNSNQVEAMDENDTLADYVSVRFRLEAAGENRASLFGQSVAAYLKRAPKLMARSYLRNSSVGVRSLLSRFALQDIPKAAIDYSLFADRIKGLEAAAQFENLNNETERFRLPKIIYTVSTSDIYQPIGALLDGDRTAFGLGVETDGRIEESHDIVWVAAEIESKLEAPAELTEFWCDRFEMAALMSGYLNYKIWLIAPEGFSPEALDVLDQRNAIGSSRRQVELLREYLGSGISGAALANSEEYEITVPMGGDSELIAANAMEDIARRHRFGLHAINQMKTAIVEASINAAEHSHSPDGKIHHRFAVSDDRMVITVSNRGVRIQNANGGSSESEEGRRGWGLKLIHKLMDEVRFNAADDGTSISMTKFRIAPETI